MKGKIAHLVDAGLQKIFISLPVRCGIDEKNGAPDFYLRAYMCHAVIISQTSFGEGRLQRCVPAI